MVTVVITDLHDKAFELEISVHIKEGYEVKGFSHCRDEHGDSWYSALLTKD